ncbi:MAG: AarF/ABC1/UbiB kinase family protein [Deltaproteobacteria bacterium]|nr:AarF/ABC1/UbiB kinase family protein [Deltaproteobacteria bacterium]
MIAGAALRYWWLQKRERWRPKWRPSQAAWDRAHRKTGRAIYGLATKLGGALVKLGQVLGARVDVLPPALVEPLRGLHDRVPSRPLAKLRTHVERELGRPIEEVFAEIEPEAMAAASLAQVHRAKLKDGTLVAVKIQYPEAKRLFPIDMASMRRAVRVARWLNRALDLRPVAKELQEFVTLELEFSREARSTERVRANVADDPTVAVPRVYTELSTNRLLVLEFLHGTPLSKIDVLRERGTDLRATARKVAELYARMIFKDGFFHGDPHPGNILVLDDGRLGLLDFGLAKELPEGFAASAGAMIAGAMSGDNARAVAAARKIGFVIPDERAAVLTGMVRMLMGDYRDASKLLEGLTAGELEIPTHFTLIGRVMVILSGLSHSLVPNERIIGGALVTALAPHLMVARA